MRIFITGGAGFIGCNSADHFLRTGHQVTIYDNLSRKGTANNLAWLKERHTDRTASLRFIEGDIREYETLSTAIKETAAEVVLHLAGQVAVTTSVHNPREDFEINALGTFNVLEAVRNFAPEAILIYASTNKVYGDIAFAQIKAEANRYVYSDMVHGVPETIPLDFHSPYGCSKGAGDQYVIDYARIYNLRTVSMRQSCIYGPRQFGVEDQGWVAHFIIAVVMNRPLSIYGDGKQVRDILHISDLIKAYEAAIREIDTVSGEAFNIGGGPDNSMSIWTEFGELLEELSGRKIEVAYGDWRPGDQKVFIADIRRAKALLNWEPAINVPDGVADLYRWVASNRDLFE